jgi:hypothetical protein
MKLIDKRFDDINKRIDESNRRFDKRFDESNLRRRFDKRFDESNRPGASTRATGDTNKRIDALERRQREDSKAFSAQIVDLGKDVATLAGRVDEAAAMVAAALQAVLGVVVTRRGGKDRGSWVMEQAAFAAAGSDED